MSFPARIRPALRLALLVLALGAACAAPASAQPDALVPQSILLDGPDKPPPGFTVTPREARRTVERLDKVRSELADHPKARAYVQLPMYGGYRGVYAVTFIDSSQGEVVADVYVDGRTGRVVEVWTGPQAGTFLARGLEPSVGRSLNKAYIWLPLAVLFLLPFVDPRRPFRLVHLDLLVLLSFGVSQIYFNKGEIDVSVPLVYPPLLYLLARVLLAGFRPRGRAEPLMPYARASWLVVGLGLLVAFRIGLNIVDSSVIDVGYASVVGADRIMHGLPLYVLNDIHGDTYGPINYLSYIPFVALLPWDGTWDSVVPAHAAAITFDLVVIGGLVQLGRRMRAGAEGTLLGLAFAWAWAAYPFSVLALQTNTNDALVAALLIGALLAITSPSGRGLLIGLGTAAKFAPLALAPLFATGLGDERRPRAWTAFGLALFAVCLGSVVFLLPDGGWRELYDTTIGFQLGRTSPFSVWGLHPSLDWLQAIAKAGVVALVVLVGFVPRRRDLRQVAALAAGVLIALQITTTYWFYLYLVWIVPPILVAVLAAYGNSRPAVRSPLRLFTGDPMYVPKARVSARPRHLADPDHSHLKRGRPMLRKLRQRIHNGEKGFTLIELLVVILIIGILAAIALPAFLGQRSKGQDADAKSAARNLVSAVESFYATNQTYVGAASDNDVTQSGVFGATAGKADISTATTSGYTIVGHSASNNNFTITKNGSSGLTTRTCTSTGSGACPTSGSW